jgi:hypothetical protein
VNLPPYTHEEVNKLRAERDSARDELGDVSKKFGVAELEWEEERKQYLGRITGKGICIFFIYASILSFQSISFLQPWRKNSFA